VSATNAQMSSLIVDTVDVEIKAIKYWSDSASTQNAKTPSELNLSLFKTDTQNLQKIIAHVPFKLWIELDVSVASPDSNFYFISNALENATLFIQNASSGWQSEVGGLHKRWNKNAFIFNFKATPNKTHKVFFLIEHKTFYLRKLHIGLMSQKNFIAKQSEYRLSEENSKRFDAIFLITIFVISFYAFLQFSLNKNKAYLIYGLFALCLFLGTGSSFSISECTNFMYGLGFSKIGFCIERIFYMIGHILQSLFFIEFFKLTRKNFRYYTFYLFFLAVQSMLLMLFATIFFFNLPYIYIDVVRTIDYYVLALGSSITLVMLYKERKGKVTNIIIAGTAFLTLNSILVYTSLSYFGNKSWLKPEYFGFGFLGEVILFWISLAYRDRETERAMLKFKTDALSNEIKALRSQMNPHFIFNCLNSLNLFILENHIDAASDYLQRFSKLIRLVLENSRLERIPLKNELETIQLYMNLEAMRFKEKLKFHISVDDDIETEMITVPPLLFQPFIENSIWHGLMHKIDGGTIHLKISQPNEKILQAEIIDDGIGRAAATEMKSKSTMLHKSFGMKVTKERIAAINEIYNMHADVEVFDLFDAHKNATGTKVVIQIPV